MSRPAWTSPSPDEVPFHCRTCRRALHRRETPDGIISFLHPAEVRGGTSDHSPKPAPVTEIDNPIIECDFCSHPDAAWIYVCADQESETSIVTARTVGIGDYRRRHHAARARSVETTPGLTSVWGERWSTCDGCATLIEARDLYALISRVTDAMPAKYTRGKRVIAVRGHLHGNYSTVLATLRPGRAPITPQHPLGVWTETEPHTADTGHGPAFDG